MIMSKLKYIAILTMLQSSMLPALLRADNTASIVVSPTTTYQTVGGIGGNIVYYEEWVTESWSKEAIYDTIFNGLGISALRMANWWDVNDARVPDQVEIFKEAKSRCGENLPVVISAWTCPAEYKACQSLNGSNSTGKGSLKKDSNGNFVYDDYAEWWAKSMEGYANLGMTPEYVSLQNEPDMDTEAYFTMVFKPTEQGEYAGYDKALQTTYARLQKLQNPPKFIGADNLGIGWNQTQEYINALDKTLLDGYGFHYYHSGINTHDYDGQRYNHPEFFEEAMKKLATDLNDKPMWMTENSPLRDLQTDDAVYTAWFIANAFNWNRVQYYLYWNLLWGDKENAVINIETDSSKTKTDLGFTVNGIYHGLRHFSKFVRPGMITLGSESSNGDVITTAFRSVNSDSCVVILINKGETQIKSDIDLGIKNKTFRAHSYLTVPREGIWSRDNGIVDGTSITLPAMSIATVTYKEIPGKQIYICEAENGGEWTMDSLWQSGRLPLSYDTTVIRKGEARIPNTVSPTAPCYVEQEGILRPTDNVEFRDIILQGGVVRISTNNPQFTLTAANINVEKPSTMKSSSGKSITTFDINAPISGEADLTKQGNMPLRLFRDNSAYKGKWNVKQGYLSVAHKSALGSNGAVVDSAATLQVLIEATTHNLSMADSARLELYSNLKVQEAELGGEMLAVGNYTKNNLPNNISQNGKLVVLGTEPKIKKVSGIVSQQVYQGEFSSPIVYSWSGADSISVSWIGDNTSGLSYSVDQENQTMTIVGQLDSLGTYGFSIVAYNSFGNNTTIMEGIMTSVPDTRHDTAKILLAEPLAQTVYASGNITKVELTTENTDSVEVMWEPAVPAGVALTYYDNHAYLSGKIDSISEYTWHVVAMNKKTGLTDTVAGTINVVRDSRVDTVKMDCDAPIEQTVIVGQAISDIFVYVKNADTIVVTWFEGNALDGIKTWVDTEYNGIAYASGIANKVGRYEVDFWAQNSNSMLNYSIGRIINVIEDTIPQRQWSDPTVLFENNNQGNDINMQYTVTYADSVQLDWKPSEPDWAETVIEYGDSTVTVSVTGDASNDDINNYTIVLQGFNTYTEHSATDTVDLKVNIETAVGGTASYSRFSIWPNPAEDIAVIDMNMPCTSQFTLYISTTDGRCVWSGKATVAAGQSQVKLNVSDLAAGVYTVAAVADNGQHISGKLIKK